MRSVKGDHSGSVVVLFAFALPVLVMVGAFAVDLSSAYVIDGRLQNAADAGALASALDIDKDPVVVRATAVSIAQQNATEQDGTISTAADVELGVYDGVAKTFTVGGAAVNAVRVTTHRTRARGNELQTVLAGLIGVNFFDITAEAIALAKTPQRCVYALNASANGSFSTGGSGVVRVPNCGIQVNSSHSNAMSVSGASSVVSKENCIRGGYSGAITAAPKAGCSLSPDPLATIPEPVPSAACDFKDVSITADQSFTAGRTYCGTIKVGNTSTLLMENGIYYFKGAHLQFANSAHLVTKNALIFLDSASSLTFSSSGSINMEPPTTGPYRGISIFGSRVAQTKNEHIRLGGGTSMVLNGSLYAPKHQVTMRGNSDLSTANSGYVIADKFDFGGSSDVVISMKSLYSPQGLSTGGKLVR